jgi:multidrug resistance efflux pump
VRSAETEVVKARKSRDVWDKTREAAHAAELAARARWERSKDPWRKEEKKHALSEMNAARADLVNAQQEHDRISNLYRTNAVTRGEYDAALGTRDRALGRYEMAKSRHEMLEAKGRKEDIEEAEHEYKRLRAKREELENGPTPYEEVAVAEARLAELQGKLKEIQININEGVIRAPEKAVVEVVAVRPGDLVAANQPVVRVLRAQDMWVKVYVPEIELGKVRLGQLAEVYCDAYPNHKFQGRVIQVATISEFTPRNVQSVDERRHQVFAVKIRVDDPQGVFRSGMAAQVVLPLATAP